MARGNVPRQPSRSGLQDGRQEGARRRTATQLKAARAKNAPARPHAGRAPAKPGKAPANALKTAAPKKKAALATGDAASRVSTYDPLAPERVRQIIAGLDQLYPGVTCALTHRSAWELLVATILSAQSTDVRVNMVTPGLFAKYPTVQDFAGNVPHTMDELLNLPGVARKTANVVLGTWFKKNEGVVVDTHVTRISRRLELTKQDDPKKIEEDLMRIIPRERWTDFSHEV